MGNCAIFVEVCKIGVKQNLVMVLDNKKVRNKGSLFRTFLRFRDVAFYDVFRTFRVQKMRKVLQMRRILSILKVTGRLVWQEETSMAEKDMTEKTLEAYNDVFADIVNVLLFGGRRLVGEDDLEDETPRSIYKADGEIHEEERDVAKRWKDCGVRIALFGIENQTEPERNMPIRVIGYDGAAYRSQLLRNKKNTEDDDKVDLPAAEADLERAGWSVTGMGGPPEKKEKYYPVVTLVLYLGYKRHWNEPLTLYDCFSIPDDLKPYVNDYRINLFEIAWLSDEQLRMFTSDFKYLADYCIQMRKQRDYEKPSELVVAADKDTVKHYDELFKLFTVMTGDPRFEETANEVRREGGPRTVCEVLDRIEARGEVRGEQRGKLNTWLVAVRNLVESTKWTVDQAMEALGIPAAEQKEIKAKL